MTIFNDVKMMNIWNIIQKPFVCLSHSVMSTGLNSQNTHMLSLNFYDKWVFLPYVMCTSARVSSCEGQTLPRCGMYAATTKILHTGPRKRTQQTRSLSESNDRTLDCILFDKRMLLFVRYSTFVAPEPGSGALHAQE